MLSAQTQLSELLDILTLETHLRPLATPTRALFVCMSVSLCTFFYIEYNVVQRPTVIYRKQRKP